MSETDQLNELLLELSSSAKPENVLLLEHLESARFYLYGAMPREYRMSLAMARKQLKSIDNDVIRARVDHFTREQRTIANTHR
jgi:hypothetical protein